MKKIRKSAVLLLIIALSLTGFAGCSNSPAEEDETGIAFPERTIEFIVPYGAGGGTDVMARAVANALTENEGWTTVVTNIEGASAAIGSMEGYNRDPDGYTIIVHSIEAMLAYYLGGVYEVDLASEYEMLATVVYDPNVVSVATNSKFQTWQDVVDYAKENPGELSWASVGSKSSNEQGSAELWKAAGIEVNYVPYDSASKSRPAVLGGHSDVLFGQLSEVKALVDSGEMKILGVSAEERLLYDDVPTFSEQGYDVVNGLHRGFFLPPETPVEIVDILETAIYDVCQNTEFVNNMENNLGYAVVFVGAEDLETLVVERMPIQQALWDMIKE